MSRRPRVLVACEYSGRVRDAFRAAGCDAVSCDLLPSDVPGPHVQGDVLELLEDGWDLMVAHPPCTYLTRAGTRWFTDPRPSTPTCLRGEDRWAAQREGVALFRALLEAPIPRIAVENPQPMPEAARLIGARPSQYVNPWEHGHPETKRTGLWLRRLPPLMPTDLVTGRESRLHKLPPTDDRWKLRSETYPGIAAAMAQQWTPLLLEVAA